MDMGFVLLRANNGLVRLSFPFIRLQSGCKLAEANDVFSFSTDCVLVMRNVRAKVELLTIIRAKTLSQKN
jgi:hypothetical protein